jgi:uncharacterized protein (DUF2252 family)
MAIEQDENSQVALDNRAKGKSLRKQVPRSSHGEWAAAADRPDPLSLLQQQDEGRIEHLLPIKYGRIMASPFAFLRGSAVVMASDLALSPVTDFEVLLCGDAHLSNFGLFATPERNVVFDVNDFDECYPGPWEWDLKRLAASAVVAGRGIGFDRETCQELAATVSSAYRKAMQRLAEMTILDVWYHHTDATSVVKLFDHYAKVSAKRARKTVKKAHSHTTAHTLGKLTEIADGKRRIKNDPPLIVRLSEMSTDQKKWAPDRTDIQDAWRAYLESLSKERRRLLQRYHMSDAALRVGGVGSVGTRCWIILIEGDKPDDALILQQKEAGTSALAHYLTDHDYPSQAERVVVGQRLMQASSDIFLGWQQARSGTHYYWRQLKDMKGSFDVTALEADGLVTYLTVCASCLARAHARWGEPAATISGYLGSSTIFDEATSKFAMAYADQTEKDYQALVEAVNDGRILAQIGA